MFGIRALVISIASREIVPWHPYNKHQQKNRRNMNHRPKVQASIW